MNAFDKQLTQLFQQQEWLALGRVAELLQQPVAELWDPMVEHPSGHSKMGHAERIYLIRVHRHQLTPQGILVGAPTVSDESCPRCRNGESYLPSPWAIWNSPHCYVTTEAAAHAVAEYIRTHPGWHHASTITAAWDIPISANLVQGVDSKTLSWFLGHLTTSAEFMVHRHRYVVGGYERVDTWVTQSGTTSSVCPACGGTDATEHCLRCGAAIASPLDRIDRVQGFNGSRGLTVWHLDPPGCTACVPTGWSD